jgi:ligand-binding sensor domain-containing protein
VRINSLILIIVIVIQILITHVSAAEWIKTNMQDSVVTNVLLIKGTDIFAGTNGGGIFLSTDKGINWNSIDSGITNMQITSLAMNNNYLFSGTRGDGVFRSNNNGLTWTAVNAGLTNLTIQTLAAQDSNLYAGTDSGIYFSANSGANWVAANSGLSWNVNGIRCLVISDTTVFASTCGNGVFKSTDNGTSWIAAVSGLEDPCIQSLAVSGSNIFAGTPFGGVFRSTNNGSNWNNLNSHTTGNFCLLANGPKILVGTYSGVYLSINNGTSWDSLNVGAMVKYGVQSIAVIDSILLAGFIDNTSNKYGIWRLRLSDATGAAKLNNSNIGKYGYKLTLSRLGDHNAVLTFSLQGNEKVKISIYDLKGKQIASIVNECLSAGMHSKAFSAKNMPEGFYIVKMQVDKYLIIKRIPLAW